MKRAEVNGYVLKKLRNKSQFIRFLLSSLASTRAETLEAKHFQLKKLFLKTDLLTF